MAHRAGTGRRIRPGARIVVGRWPISLDPDGVTSLGLIIGRASLEAIATNFAAEVVNRVHHPYPWPDRESVFGHIRASVEQLTAAMTPRQRDRFAGVGIAAPGELHGWEAVIGAPAGALANWRGVDIGARVAAETGHPTLILNDASAACLAEMSLGVAGQHRSALYLFIATFVGGGLVLHGQLYPGDHGNAAAVGSMPLQVRGARVPPQLIEAASLFTLRQRIGDADLYARVIDGTAPPDDRLDAMVGGWIDEAARAIGFAITAASAVVDFEAAIIDGVMARGLLGRLIAAVQGELGRYNKDGLTATELRAGAVGRDARQRGAAMLPFYANFAPDSNLLLKDQQPTR